MVAPKTVRWFLSCCAVLTLSAAATWGLEQETSLVTGQPIGRLAVAGRLDVDLHAEFMVSRTFEKDTALNWYNCGYSGAGRHTEAGGNFGDFGLHVPHTQRDDKYPHWVAVDKIPAVRFDGNDIMKGNFAVEAAATDNEDLALELWVRDEDPDKGEVILGWQTADGSAASASLSYPDTMKGSPKWRHLVLNCTADGETWYLDGKPLGKGPRKWVIRKGHRMVLGGASAARPSFKGDLAAVRLHEKAMTAEEIAHNFKGGVMLGTQCHSWWRNEPDKWWTKESEHFRHCVDKKEMAAWNEKQKQQFNERVPKMFEMAEKIYRLYSERHALRIGVVSCKFEFRGDGIKYKIPIQPSKGSWMGWNGKFGFGYACQGAGHINPHELVHGCQGQTGGAIQGNYWEAHANFPQTYAGIYQTVPSTFCSRVSMFFPANGRDYYHARLMFEHLAQTPEYGPMFISKLWYDSRPAPGKQQYPWIAFTEFDPDPSTPLAYEWTRMVQRCVTWDFETFDPKRPDLYAQDALRGKHDMERYGRTLLEKAPFQEGWWRVPREMAPQQLGRNVCPMKIKGKKVSVELAGYTVNKERGSDWRAAFVAVDAKGKPHYSDIVGTGKLLEFALPEDAKELYLVVCATPAKIMWIDFVGDYRSTEQEHFPYKVKLAGCEPLDILKPAKPTVAGAAHTNGGGFVAATAKVDASAYVAPDAQVLDKAQVSGQARVEDYAVIKENATVRDQTRVSGYAQVSGKATIRDRAKLRDYAVVTGNTVIRDRARILEHAFTWRNANEVYGDATMKGVAGAGGRVGGSAVLDGHYMKCNEITKGAWFTWSWGKGKNPGELEQELGGLQAQYTFETSHPCLAWDTHGATHAYLNGKPSIATDAGRSASGKGAVLYLNGRDQWLEFPRSAIDLVDLTIDVYVKWDGGEKGQRLVECTGANCSTLLLTPSDTDGKLTFSMKKDGPAQTLRAPALPAGAWHRVQVMLSGDTGRLYVDGKAVAENKQMTLNPEDLNPRLCLIGRGVSGHFFKGSLDDVSFYCNSLVDEVRPAP